MKLGTEEIHIETWTDDPSDKREPRALSAPPKGYRDAKCPKCASADIRGALATATADDLDPNLVCGWCGYWWD